MSVLSDTSYIIDLRVNSDHNDVHFAIGERDLADVVARLMSYQPWWLWLLYAIRVLLAKALRLRTDGLPRRQQYTAADISFDRGAELSFFSVDAGEPDRYWAGTISDKHLNAWLVVTRDDMHGGLARFGLTTFVTFHNRSGRFYFALIKPFHHLVVRSMLRYAVKS
ncbi:DUF2867 domain-containing protein [bacterium]|nr:DUF2867 domain-containing protein [bacterium]